MSGILKAGCFVKVVHGAFNDMVAHKPEAFPKRSISPGMGPSSGP